jgi:CheY-like chemotaxis protein
MANILVVDDDHDVLETLASALSREGHSVTSVSSGIEALDRIDRGLTLDLLLTDVVMPGLNGFNLGRMVHMKRPSVAILYLTGYSEQAVAMQDAGDKYGRLLTKPIWPADLAREVQAALGR